MVDQQVDDYILEEQSPFQIHSISFLSFNIIANW